MPTLLMLKALPWKLIGLAALGVALVLMYAALKMEKAQNVKLKAQLERISTAKNEQKQTTGRTIAETRIIYRDAESRAQRVEKAPTVERCKTPQEILSADL